MSCNFFLYSGTLKDVLHPLHLRKDAMQGWSQDISTEPQKAAPGSLHLRLSCVRSALSSKFVFLSQQAEGCQVCLL